MSFTSLKLRAVCGKRIALPGALLALLLVPDVCYAYIGPGAGFAFLGSAAVLLITAGLALVTVLFLPFRIAIRALKRRKLAGKSRYRRVVIIGLDGLEPSITERMIDEGHLPELKALAEQGAYSRLGTTLPALSPVAWSTFQTGVNPGAHNIFDFLTRDKRRYFPKLSSTNTVDGKKSIGVGKLRIAYGGPRVELARKSQPFWKLLGKYGIFSNIIRVPISYPPEKCFGNVLSAMCTPDLRGTQGSFTYYSSDAMLEDGEQTGGEVRTFETRGESLTGEIAGPPDGKGGYAKVRFELTTTDSGTAILSVGGAKYNLVENQFSDWIKLEFSVGRRSISGLARFCLRQTSPQVALYISPVNVDPDKPALPIAKPILFSAWLAKRLGNFGTLGLMEDTWGRNEFALDDQRFLDQAYLNHAERERMLFEALDRTREGLCVCVFDASDRIQHMFWRYLDPGHPSPLENGGSDFSNAIPEMYRKMDNLIGQVRRRLGKDDLLLVLSDHGFASFRRGINLNTWLKEQGYLVLKEGASGASDYLRDVDWSKTKAFALGLTGLYINLKGRESFGIVSEAEAKVLKREIATKLEALCDPQTGEKTINKVYDASAEYRGLYTAEAPDLIVGYNPGYRVSWDSVTGILEPEVFSDNVKAWSGDHHVDPELIPGIFFASEPLKAERPHIRDLAPTVLEAFGVPVPGYMEGRAVL